MLFCSLIKGTTLKIHMLCFFLINSIILNLLCVWKMWPSLYFMVVYTFVFVSVFAWCPIGLKTYGDSKIKFCGMLCIHLCCIWLLWDKERFWSLVYSLCFIILVSIFLLEQWKCLEYCAYILCPSRDGPSFMSSPSLTWGLEQISLTDFVFLVSCADFEWTIKC